MLGNILEISSRASKGGRLPIKIALLKIHDDEKETNANGLHWKEEYVRNALDSIKMMPICATFLDEEKSVPLDHGETGYEVYEDGVLEPLFENSETVGCFEHGQIEELEINGETKKVLTANGYLYIQRYPAFVKWVRETKAKNDVDTSIEIMGTDVNDNKIIYEEGIADPKFRTPKEFLFSGSTILSVSPADSDAIVLEVAAKKNKEEYKLDNKELKELIHEAVAEANSNRTALETQISELNTQVAAKDEKISELNATAEQLRATIDKMEKEHETFWQEMEVLRVELAKAKVAEKLAEIDGAFSEFNEEEKKIAAEDIAKLKEGINACVDPSELNTVTTEINSIKSKICMDIVSKQKAQEAEKRKVSEVNDQSKSQEVIDIFSEVCTEEMTEEEDVNIF